VHGGGVYSATLNQCTLVENFARASGGGAYGSDLNECILSTNSATSGSSGSGGGAGACKLVNCTLKGNFAYAVGGGANTSSLTNCTLTQNSVSPSLSPSLASSGGGAAGSYLHGCNVISNTAYRGGGTVSSTQYNCTLFGNRANNWGGGARNGLLNNCTIISNSATSLGGGAADALLAECVLIKNSSFNGGGLSSSSLNNCLVVSNSAANVGGGGYASYMTNCSVFGNSGFIGGGVSLSTLINSVVYFNTATTDANYHTDTVIMQFSCSTPLLNGTGNFAEDPILQNIYGGNFRLQTNSPCINAGDSGAIQFTTDLDGRPRIVSGTVDVGAYEFQGLGMGEFVGWLQTSGLPTDGSADYTDADSDGMSNYGEWRSDTIPTNSLSVLKMVNATNSPTGAKVTWQSVSTRNYWLERATNLGVASPFQSVATNIVGVAGTKTFTDTSATNGGPYFYRVGVQ
jgi:hypothetical protein